MNIITNVINNVTQVNCLGLTIFFALTLVNVMLGTIKSILTIKGTRIQATLMNSLAFGFNTVVIKEITKYDIYTTVTITILANLIGVYVSILIMDKLRKDDLWIISVTAHDKDTGENIIEELNKNDIAFRVFNIQKKSRDTIGLDIFSESQKQSIVIKSILSGHKVKYHIIKGIEG